MGGGCGFMGLLPNMGGNKRICFFFFFFVCISEHLLADSTKWRVRHGHVAAMTSLLEHTFEKVVDVYVDQIVKFVQLHLKDDNVKDYIIFFMSCAVCVCYPFLSIYNRPKVL